jgi:hypothetical protein
VEGFVNRSANSLEIVVFKDANGLGWHYCPRAALDDPRIARAMRYTDEEGFATVREALNAIVLDKSIPRCTPVSVEGASEVDMAEVGLPFLARAKEAFDQLEAECHGMTAGPEVQS